MRSIQPNVTSFATERRIAKFALAPDVDVALDLEGVRRYRPSQVDDGRPGAAVCVALVERTDATDFLFTERSLELDHHPGEMSFPGGRRETGDATLRDTALREASEEVGVDPDDVVVVGQLDDLPAILGIVVRPFVVLLPDRTYTPQTGEVETVVTLPVSAFTRPENYESEQRTHPQFGPFRLHIFRVDDHVIWGLTGQLVASVLELTTDWEIPATADRVVDFDAELPE